MKCNLCGNDNFADMNKRKNVRCSKCGSLERTRLLWMYLENLKIDKKTKVLHLAPEKGLYRALSQRVENKNYIVADIDPKGYPFSDRCLRIDLCSLEDQPSCTYDLIIHSHVLEQTPCSIAYTLFHLHRMLTKNGRHICVIPFMSGKYDECFQPVSEEERIRRFGQNDHVRRFGREDISSHLGKIVTIPANFDATAVFKVQDLCDANIPAKYWKGFHISTVLDLKKNDFRLQK